MLMGTITGVGGGVIRDILLARVPLVLRADIYASAAFFGALVVVLARRAGVSLPRLGRIRRRGGVLHVAYGGRHIRLASSEGVRLLGAARQ